MTGVLIKREKSDTDTEGRQLCDDRDKDWNYASTIREKPRNAGIQAGYNKKRLSPYSQRT